MSTDTLPDHEGQPREHPVPCKGYVHPHTHAITTWRLDRLCEECAAAKALNIHPAGSARGRR